MNHFLNFLLVACFFMMPSSNSFLGAELFHPAEHLLAQPAEATGTTQYNDSDIIKRIVRSYQKNASKVEKRGRSMWQGIFDDRHKAIHEIFYTGDISQATKILRDPGSTDLFYGFDMLSASILSQKNSPASRLDYAKNCLDGLVRCAESMGAIRLDNPEHHQHKPPVDWETNNILSLIGLALNAPISFPNPFPKEIGLASAHGVISYRVPQALYQAWRIKQIVKKIENPRVLEIGAGLGRTAQFCRQLGISDYTIVDFPMTQLASGYFLGRVFGKEHVVYSGEKNDHSKSKIKFLTPEEFLADKKNYDLIVNVDGFTEMDPTVAKRYWKKIENHASHFLSINHEVNPFTVKELIDASDKVKTVHRQPYWMRMGYVEELVKFKK